MSPKKEDEGALEKQYRFTPRLWDASRLEDFVRSILGDRKIIVMANREPYQHKRVGGELQYFKPAGGVVTALDPVLRAVGGVWVGHGSGGADKMASDEKGRVEVPPKDPRYLLRRIFLSKEEEKGYYFGFSNEALWPLCHVAYIRPRFRWSDWKTYEAVNRKFAEAALEEVGDDSALVMVQDYHLALVPKFLKEARPDLGVVHFWHIPWPNAEVFRICPWRREIFEGLMGNDLLAFHLQYYCLQFLESIESEMQVRVDREHQCIFHGDQVTYVRPFPIGMDAVNVSNLADSEKVRKEEERLRIEHHLTAEVLAVGVDRLDYTKGIPERLQAIDRFLELHPEWHGRFQYIGAAAPSRTHIREYQDLADTVEDLVRDINWRYGSDQWQPVVVLNETIGPETAVALYRMGRICLVTSLQDGMNLVAKEYVASQGADPGVLILSCFAGAARDLPDALIVNPYDIEGMAHSIHEAIEMPEEERRVRMERMRTQVFQRNVYDWARRLFDAGVKRVEGSVPVYFP
ncbi:MAG: trehalose-6-phosphate synthase [Candidatus Hydrogenedentota bacterium]|nr:MAG: trehalose-6-phosphate synthase [Candidatus Hydrogenedentota bacterium]